jgi:cysteinyl-tRNA synthetase
MHGEFLRLLFLQTHWETEAHFTAAGMSSRRNQSDSFRFKRGILPVAEEQSRTRGSQSSGVEDQPHSSSPSARSLSRSPSPPPSSFTQSPSLPRVH